MPSVTRSALLAALLVTTTAHAADRDGNFAVKGIGLASCADFLESVRTEDERLPMFYGWVSGFLTAMNLHGTDTYDLIDWQSDAYIAESLSRWCQDNREERFFSGVYQMARSLEAFKVTARSPVVVMDGPDGRIRLYRATLDRVRDRLAAMDLLAQGEEDPDALKTALRAYQGRENLPQTGVPDTATLFRLFSSE